MAENETGEQLIRQQFERGLQVDVERVIGEQVGSYPIQGKDLQDVLSSIEIGPEGDVAELEEIVADILGYTNGLVFGRKSEAIYKLDKLNGESDSDYRDRLENSLIYLQGLFATKEDATERRQTFYVDTSVDEALEARVRVAERLYPNLQDEVHAEAAWRKRAEEKIAKSNRARLLRGRKPLDEDEARLFIEAFIEDQKEIREKVLREHKAIPKLVELRNRVRASRVFGGAFLQRMGTSENPQAAANLLEKDDKYRPPFTPDKTHFLARFKGEEGQVRDRVLRAIVRVATPPPKQDRVIERGNGAAKQVNPEVEADGFEIPTAVYATGFESTESFKRWFQYLLKEAGGDPRILLESWQDALTMELPAQLGRAIERKVKVGDNGEKEIEEETIVIANPPVGNAIGPWVMQLDDKQRVEWGLDAKGERIVVEKNPTHTGYPLNFLGPETFIELLVSNPKLLKTAFTDEKNPKIAELLRNPGTLRESLMALVKRRNPAESFLHESKVEISRRMFAEDLPETARILAQNHPDEKTKESLSKIINDEAGAPKSIKISLRDLWQYGELSFAGRVGADGKIMESFPWLLTEQKDEGSEGELPPGSFGGWLLRRFRAFAVVQDIRSRPSKQDVSNPEFFPEKLRNWQKVFGAIKNVPPDHKDYVEPWQNPRMWWVAGIVHAIQPRSPKSLVLSDKKELDYRPSAGGTFAEARDEGMAETISVKDVLHDAVKPGFLRQVDADWIVKNIGG